MMGKQKARWLEQKPRQEAEGKLGMSSDPETPKLTYSVMYLLQQITSLRHPPNNTTNWGPSLQTLVPMVGILIQATTEGKLIYYLREGEIIQCESSCRRTCLPRQGATLRNLSSLWSMYGPVRSQPSPIPTPPTIH